MDNSAKPALLTDRHDPNLAHFHQFMDQLRQWSDQVINLRVPPDVVAEGDVGMFKFLVLAAQHHPDILERLLFGFNFQFLVEIDGEEAYSAAEWKAAPAVQRWLARLTADLPWAVFFLSDYEARFLSLFGDVLNDERDEIEVRSGEVGQRDVVALTPQQATLLNNRVLHASNLLLHFCRPLNMEPRPAIEALLAELNVTENYGWDYDRLYARFQEEVASGFAMRTAPE